MEKSFRRVVSCLSLIAAVGCSPATEVADAARPGTDVGAGIDVGPGSTLVGASGGTVSGPDGTRLVVPPGALSTDVAITIEVVAMPAGASFGTTPIGATYRFLPHGLTFSAPVTVDLPIAPTGSRITLLTLADDADTTWEVVEGGTIDATGGHVPVSHLSYFSFGVCDPLRHVCWPCDPPSLCEIGTDAGPPVDAGPFDAGPPSCATACVAPEVCLFVPDSSPSRGFWDCRPPCAVDADCAPFVPVCVGTASVTSGSIWCASGGCTGAQTLVGCPTGTTCSAGLCS